MSTADLVMSSDSEKMLVQPAERWSSADIATCKEVISRVKKIIKPRKSLL